MKTKHTPGPWIIKKVSTSKINAVRIVAQNDHSRIASIQDVYNNEPYFTEGKANAQLIATAPELLTALSNLLTVAEKQLDQSATHEGLTNADIIAKARKAIRNATN